MKDAALKNFMKTDRPRLSLGADNTLQMVFNNQVTMGIIEDQKKYLEQELADAFGKDIKVEIRALAKGEQFEESYIDLEAIKSAIQFDVVTEDEESRPVEDTDYGFMTESLQNLSPEDDGNSFEEKDEPEDEA